MAQGSQQGRSSGGSKQGGGSKGGKGSSKPKGSSKSKGQQRGRSGSGKQSSGKQSSGSKSGSQSQQKGRSGNRKQSGSGKRSGSYGGRSYQGSKSSGGRQGQRGSGGGARGGSSQGARGDLRGAAVDLPRWVVEELTRVTPKERAGAALEALGEAANAFGEGRYHPAMRRAEQAKKLAPRDATTRELLGLSAYRIGDWAIALRELRTYRRISGETTHMPVEMDCLRAMGRTEDVPAVWDELQDRGGRPGVVKEGKVVYASWLIDEGRVDEARRLVTPRGLRPNPFPEDLRLWYVAARAAALAGDTTDATRLRNAILEADPGFPGIDELETLIAAN